MERNCKGTEAKKGAHVTVYEEDFYSAFSAQLNYNALSTLILTQEILSIRGRWVDNSADRCILGCT